MFTSRENAGMKNAKAKLALEIIVLIVCCVATGIYLGSFKEISFCDEAYTYESANALNKERVFDRVGEWLTGEDFNDYFAATEWNPRFKWLNMVLWPDHVPGYFYLFRLVSIAFFFGNATKWTGLAINIVLHAIFTIWIFLQLRSVFKKDELPFFITFLYALASPLILNQVLLIRMYLLLSFECLLLLKVEVRLLSCRSRRTWIMFGILNVFGFLTHYYYWIYFACLSGCVACVMLKRKEFKTIIGAGLLTIADLGIVTLIYKYWVTNLLIGKGRQSIKNILRMQEVMDRLKWGIERVCGYIFHNSYVGCYVIFCAVLIILIVWLVKKRKLEENVRNSAILGIVSMNLYLVAVSISAPTQEDRYLIPAASVLLLVAMVLVGMCLREVHCRYGVCILLTVVALFAEYRSVVELKHISVTRQDGQRIAVLKENADIPWLVHLQQEGAVGWMEMCSAFEWLIPERICILSDGIYPKNDEILQSASELLVYVSEEKLEEMVANLQSIGINVDACDRISQSYYCVYKLQLSHSSRN